MLISKSKIHNFGLYNLCKMQEMINANMQQLGTGKNITAFIHTVIDTIKKQSVVTMLWFVIALISNHQPKVFQIKQ